MFYTVNVGKKWDFYCCLVNRGCFSLIWGLLNTALIVVKCITIIFLGGELLSINHAILVQCTKM